MRQKFWLTLGSLLRQISITQVRIYSLKMQTDLSDFDDYGNSSRPTTSTSVSNYVNGNGPTNGTSPVDFTGKKLNFFPLLGKTNENLLATDRWISLQGFRFYHETQSLSLCALHAINNLLQEPAFNQPELNLIADSLYTAELQLHNINESIFCDTNGNFSIEVIEEALRPYNIILLRLRNPLPSLPTANAYIIQNADHWFTIRKAGDQWFNLNSLRPRPILIPNFNLCTFVNQLGGNPNVFFVNGPIPPIQRIVNFEGKKVLHFSQAGYKK